MNLFQPFWKKFPTNFALFVINDFVDFRLILFNLFLHQDPMDLNLQIPKASAPIANAPNAHFFQAGSFFYGSV